MHLSTLGLLRKKSALGNARVRIKGKSKNSTHLSHAHKQDKYGKEAQMIEDEPESPSLSKVEQKLIQKVTGKFLYLGRAVDSTLLRPLSAIASHQAALTQNTMQHTKQLLARRCCTNLPCQ